MRLVLKASALPVAPTSRELPLAFLPPEHLRGEEIVILLRKNGVSCRPLGHGHVSITEDEVSREILFLAVPYGTFELAKKYLRLFGASKVELPDNQGATG